MRPIELNKRTAKSSVDRAPWSPETDWSEDLPFDEIDTEPVPEGHVQHADAVDTVLFGGLTAGLLDAIDAIVVNGVNGVHPTQVFQTVASGLLGQRAFEGGILSAALGAGLHFSIALGAAAIYLGASRRVPMLLRRPVLSGIIFGVGVWASMTFVVLPLSLASPQEGVPSGAVLINQLLIHALGLGLPISLFASRSVRRPFTQP
jgi:hypothetical protein